MSSVPSIDQNASLPIKVIAVMKANSWRMRSGVSGHSAGEWAGSGSKGAATRCEGANCAGCLHPAPASSLRAAVAQGQQV